MIGPEREALQRELKGLVVFVPSRPYPVLARTRRACRDALAAGRAVEGIER